MLASRSTRTSTASRRRRRRDGGLESGVDGFLRTRMLNGMRGVRAGLGVGRPVPGGRTRRHLAVLYAAKRVPSRWNGLVVLDRREAADIAMEDVTLKLGG